MNNNTEKNFHPYKNVIEGYISGKKIQYRGFGETNSPWLEYNGKIFPDFNDVSLEWRIKPDVAKYRIAKMHDTYKDRVYVLLINDDEKIQGIEIESRSQFVKWITDWTEVPD